MVLGCGRCRLRLGCPNQANRLGPSTCALLSAVLAYYVSDLARGVYDVIDPADAALSHVTTGWTVALADLSYWMVAALLVGPLLGVVGHAIHRTDRLGLLAELVVPTMMVGNVLLVTARLGRFQQPGSLAAHRGHRGVGRALGRLGSRSPQAPQ